MQENRTEKCVLVLSGPWVGAEMKQYNTYACFNVNLVAERSGQHSSGCNRTEKCESERNSTHPFLS